MPHEVIVVVLEIIAAINKLLKIAGVHTVSLEFQGRSKVRVRNAFTARCGWYSFP